MGKYHRTITPKKRCHYCMKDLGYYYPNEKGKRYFCDWLCESKFNKLKYAKIFEIRQDKYDELMSTYTNHIKFIKENMTERFLGDTPVEYGPILNDAQEQGKKLCIINANFKCEHCKTEDNLTVHHLLTRRLKNFMDFNKYLIQRYDYRNILCLCIDCHKCLHSNEVDWDEDIVAMSESSLIELKKEFAIPIMEAVENKKEV